MKMDSGAEYPTTDDECITSPKSKKTIPKNYASDMPLIYIVNVEKEEYPKVKSNGQMMKTEVVHNKRNYCPFCNESKVNFLPHLKQHKEEEEVAVIFKLPSRDTERNQRIDLIRLRGNHLKNLATIKEKKGMFIPLKRPMGVSMFKVWC